MVEQWDLISIGNLSRNRYWGESDDKAYRNAICTSTLVRGEDFTLIVDPPYGDEDQMCSELFRRTGLQQSDIGTVFLTHEHGDHIVGAKHFPDAQVIAAPLVADILNQMDKSTEGRILETIDARDPEMADEIRELMFVFDDLGKIDDRGLQTLLKEVDNDTLVLALRTAAETIRGKIFKNISQRAAARIAEDLENMGPTRLSDVEGAQAELVRTALRLEEEGRLSTMREGGEDQFV